MLHMSQAQKIHKSFAPITAIDRPSIGSKKSFIHRVHRPSLRKILLSLGFILAVTVIGTLLVSALSSQNGNASNQIQSVLSGEELKDYNSPEKGFTILMPGIPTISESTAKSGDKEIPITTYQKYVDNRTKNYTFAIYDYTGIQIDESKALEASLNSAMQNTPGAAVTQTKVGKYGELNAIEATYNLAEGERIYESHIRYVMKEGKMYAMILIGSDQAKFDEFANSLRLN